MFLYLLYAGRPIWLFCFYKALVLFQSNLMVHWNLQKQLSFLWHTWTGKCFYDLFCQFCKKRRFNKKPKVTWTTRQKTASTPGNGALESSRIKVQILWEGHKIWRNLCQNKLGDFKIIVTFSKYVHRCLNFKKPIQKAKMKIFYIESIVKLL